MDIDDVRQAMAELESAGEVLTKNRVHKRLGGNRSTCLALYNQVMAERAQGAPDAPTVAVDWAPVQAAQARLVVAEKVLAEASTSLDEARLASLAATQQAMLLGEGLKRGTIHSDDPWCDHVRVQVQAAQAPYHAALQAFQSAQDAVSQATQGIAQARTVVVEGARRSWVEMQCPQLIADLEKARQQLAALAPAERPGDHQRQQSLLNELQQAFRAKMDEAPIEAMAQGVP